jgi:hypothetical protein
MVDNVRLFHSILNRAKEEISSKIVVGPKSSFRIHSVINFILNLVYPKDRKDSYLNGFTTTLGYTIAMNGYSGNDASKFGNWRVLCHEIVHVMQAKKWTRFLFGILYMFPISFGIAMLLFGWIGLLWVPGLWKLLYVAGWLALSAAMFIPQLPDPWRSRWELEAYSVSMHLRHRVYGSLDDEYLDHLVKNFNSMAYYVMEPSKDKIRSRLTSIKEKIEAGESPVKYHPIVRIAEEEYRKVFLT